MKLLHLFLICFLIAAHVAINAQKTDHAALLRQIQSTTGNEKIKSLIDLADMLASQHPDSSLVYSSQALHLADSLKLYALAAEAHYMMGRAHLNKKRFQMANDNFMSSHQYAKQKNDYPLLVKSKIGLSEVHYGQMNYDSARQLLESAEALALKHNYEAPLSNIYNNLARITSNEGNNTIAIEGYLKAAELFDKQNRPDALAIVFDNIGTLYYKLKNYQDAIQYYKQAGEINEKENNIAALQNNYNNLGNAYSKIDSLEKAHYYYNLVVENARKNNNEYDLAKGYLNLANLLNREGTYAEAGRYYDSAVYYSEKNNIRFGILISKLNMGNYYNNTGNYSTSLKTYREVKTMLSKYNLPDMEASLYKSMSKAFKNLGVYDSALYYFEIYEHFSDSISGKETREKVLELEKKYESERKAREIAELQESITLEKSRNRVFIIALISLGLMSLTTVLLFLYRRRAAILREKLTLQENLELKNTMELRNKELVSKALMVSNLNEQLDKINHHVAQIKPVLNAEGAQKLDNLVKDLEITLPDHAWQEFETRFEQVHQGFFTRLLSDYSDLSPTELKICSLLRLNMSTKDIAMLTNRSIGTVDNIRSSIRKKLKLDAEANLTCFLLNF
jgi:tetratricopeptide (TPR) repeat protein/DNA-binding CsgD family transcriptional regulator